MATDPQGYPLVAYERISDNQVMFQVMSDGTIVLNTGTTISAGVGSPEGVVTAPVGSLYTNVNGTAPNILYQKQTGVGNTGWVAIGSGGGGGGTPGGADTELQYNNAGAFGGTSGVTWDAANGIQMDPVATPMSGGVNVLIDGLDTPPVTMIAGLFAAALNSNTGFISNTDLIGLDGEASCGGNGFEVDVANVIGVKSLVSAGANAVIDTMISFQAVAGTQPGAAITNYIGLHIPDSAPLSVLGSARAIQVDGGISEFAEILANPSIQVSGNGIAPGDIPPGNNTLLYLNSTSGGPWHIICYSSGVVANKFGIIYESNAGVFRFQTQGTHSPGIFINSENNTVDLMGGGGTLNTIFLTVGAGIYLPSGGFLAWNSAGASSSGNDVGLSRLSAGILAVGNGNAGNTTGKLVSAHVKVTGLQIFANNAAAITGSLAAGDFYRTGADPDVVCVVH